MSPGGSAPTDRPPTIYDVAAAAGVAASTVSRALSKPGRVSFKTAEHVRRVASELGYRTEHHQRVPAGRSTGLLAMMVADITNPVFSGMIRGAERTARHAGSALMLLESEESAESERELLDRIVPVVEGVVLSASRMTDAEIRTVAKTTPLVVVNRIVDQVPSVGGDSVPAVRRAVEHLGGLGHRTLTYLSGPEASWADGMRWRAVLDAGQQLGVKVRRIGPQLPTLAGGQSAAEAWGEAPTSAVIAYNDLVAIGFVRAVQDRGLQVPGDVSVIGFDNIRDADLVRPPLTTIASPLVSLGSAAVNLLLKKGAAGPAPAPVLLPDRLVLRSSTGPAGN
ncbi:MAG TPA: LacI family DNA-binding transcriptional regulator [Microlunatus sp.]|nr:LacI family DNA-binding transcriptional regulator [Microlunatus sp.]